MKSFRENVLVNVLKHVIFCSKKMVCNLYRPFFFFWGGGVFCTIVKDIDCIDNIQIRN